MKRIILCDLGNVLVNVNGEIAIKKISQILNLDVESVLKMVNSEIEREFEIGKLRTDEYFNLIRNRFNLPNSFNLKTLKDIWKTAFTVNEQICNLLQKLRSYSKVLILSNTTPLHIEAIDEKYNLLSKIDGAILSYEVGYKKPDPKIYHIALKRAGSIPEEAIFIDDIEENVAAAEKIGIESIQYRNFDELVKFLQLNGYEI